MIYAVPGSLPHYRFERFLPTQVLHAVFTRQGGSSQGRFASLNVGSTVGDDPAAVQANHRAIYRAMGVEIARVVTGQQVHGSRVAAVTAADGGRVLAETDALITNVPRLALLLRFADCVPVLFYDPKRRAIGLAHAGWKGTIEGVAAETALALGREYGCQPEDLLVGLGPAIGPCCFEVGTEVLAQLCAKPWARADLFSAPQPDGRAHVDLWLANALQLRAMGVQQIEVGGLCTCCHHEAFFSHRGEGGHTGRFAAVIALPDTPASA